MVSPWRRFRHCSVSGFPLPCLRSCRPYTVVFHGQERLGPPKFFDVSLPACHGLRTPADLPILAMRMVLCCLRCALKPSASATSAISKLYQHFRGHGSPCGLQDALSTLRPSCSPPSRLRHGRKTRYGWVATPYPTGTFTLQETPSFLGAITPGFRRRQWPQRRRSGGYWRSPAGPCWAAPIDARVVSDLCTPIGIVDQDRRTRTDVELCSQHHIRCKTPLEKFFARAALAQRLVQLRLHGPKGSQGHQSFW